MRHLHLSGALAAERLRWEAYDALKGLLITLIVVGHGGIGSPGLLMVQSTLYNFHAPLFLLIAFLLPVRPLTMEEAVKKARRYFVPLLWFSGLALVIFNFFFGQGRRDRKYPERGKWYHLLLTLQQQQQHYYHQQQQPNHQSNKK